MKGWCPDENIFARKTTKFTFGHFNNATIDIFTKVTGDSDILSNDNGVVLYPAKHVNKIPLNEFIETMGYSNESLADAGGFVKIYTTYKCMRLPFYRNSLHLLLTSRLYLQNRVDSN